MLRVFITGMFISLLGTLPMGTLTVSAMQISISDGYRPALLFSIGALLVEMVYVRLTLVAMGWFRQHTRLLKSMEWLTLLIILALAVSSFYAAINPKIRANPILSDTINRFWLGAAMSAINPLQIPFWFGWSTLLMNKDVLKREGNLYIPYIAGIGLGTFMGHSIFIFGGKFLADSLDASQHLIHWIVGGIFLVTAIVQWIKMVRNKDAISTMDKE